MFATVIVLLLSQAPDSAPPLVEADVTHPSMLETPPAPPPIPAAAVAVPQVESQAAAGSSAGRLAASFAGAFVGAAPAAALVLLGPQLCGSDQTCAVSVLLAGMIAAPFTTGLGAFLGHRLAGGQGTYGKALAGAAIGWGASMLAAGLVVMATRTPSSEAAWGILGVASAAAFAMTAGMLEYSHRSQSASVGLALAPVPGGALVTLGGRF